jgi:ATPase components of ABC transporters with duplicated ATPase domains
MKQFASASGLSKYYGDQLIFENFKFTLHERQRITLIGPNGTGKTSLLKIIAGLDLPDEGKMSISENTTIGYADQHVQFDTDMKIYDCMLDIVKENLVLFTQAQELEAKFATTEYGSEEFEKLSAQYEKLQQTIQQEGLYQIETKIKMLLTRFGFSREMWQQNISNLSGGQKIRLHLARVLLQEPDILLLDEPTNHLDIETIIWLNKYLLSYPNALIIITHDEKLISSLATNVWQIINEMVFVYNGTYNNYQQYINEQMSYLEKQQQKAEKEREKLTTFVEKNLVRASTTKRAQSAQKRLQKLKTVNTIRIPETLKPFTLPVQRNTGKYIFRLNDLSVGYDNPLYESLTIDIMRYDRIALVGQNGIGKSTLLNTLVNYLPALNGEFELGTQVDIAYFQQQQIFSKKNASVYATFQDVYPNAHRDIIHPILARFGFPQEDVHMNNTTLSGGEKQRLLLALLYYQKANTLLLDEPTNHLDLQSKQSLTTSLKQFDGTIIFSSHDRTFIEQLATRVIFFYQKKVYIFDTYKEFETFSLNQLDDNSIGFEQEPKASQIDRQKGKEIQGNIRRLSRELEKIEQDIEKLEQDIEKWQNCLLQEEIYSDYEVAQSYQAKIEAATKMLAVMTEEWTLVAEKLETEQAFL